MKQPAGFTILEVLVAAIILAIAVSTAAVLALATVSQEEVNHRIARCLNLHEQAARLYQLGLNPAEIRSILPADPAILTNQPVFTSMALSPINNLGTVEYMQSTLEYYPKRDDTTTRTSTLYIARPSLR